MSIDNNLPDQKNSMSDVSDLLHDYKISSPTQQEKSLDSNPSLNKWVDMLHSPDSRPTINLGLFGLKTAEDIKIFLHSPAGEVMIGELRAELMHEKSLAKQQMMKQQDRKNLMHRIHAFLFLLYLNKDVHAAKKINELVIQENEKAIERAKSPSIAKEQSLSQTSKEIAALVDSYSDALKIVQERELVLDQKIAQLNNSSLQLTQKYDLFDALIAEIDNLYTVSDIEEKINQLTDIMNEYAHDMAQSLPKGDSDDEMLFLNLLQGLHLQERGYQDMLAVCKQEKVFVTLEGEQVQSMSKAHFVLNKEQKLVKDENTGKIHLIKGHQDWEEIKRNPHAKQQARNDFKQIKNDPQCMSVKLVVKHYRQSETNIVNQQLNDSLQLKRECITNKQIIMNQLSQLQAQRATLIHQASQPDLNRELPRPTPGTTKAHIAQPSQSSATQIFRAKLQELKQQAQLTREDLFSLANLAPGKNSNAAHAYLQIQFGLMSRRGNIPFQTMQFILKNMARFGIDMTKENVTNIKSPCDLRNEASAAQSPFRMTPF